LPDLNLAANVEDTSLSRDDSNIELHHEAQSHEIEVDIPQTIQKQRMILNIIPNMWKKVKRK